MGAAPPHDRKPGEAGSEQRHRETREPQQVGAGQNGLFLSAQADIDDLVGIHPVKTHLNSVYRKLGTSSRDQTLVKARQVGLLP